MHSTFTRSWTGAALAALALFASGAFARTALADTLVVKWNDVLLECIRESKPGPPMVARAIGVTHTCGFDAWAMYDSVAVATRLGPGLRRPAEERTEANREKAYSYGAYRALLDLFPGQTDLIRSSMTQFGYDPDDASTDPATPSGVGNVCARAVTDFRHKDGSNQLGDMHPGPYSDYTGYEPVNTLDKINDPNHWQPLRFCDGKGGFVSPSYIAPQWGNVIPFALSSYDQFPAGPPQAYPHGTYRAQANKIMQLNAHIDDEEKMIAEYWADGPHSELPPGHFTLFAEFVSRRDHHTFDQDVKLFFILRNAEMDAGIAVWGFKRQYDSERPITAIHYLYAGKKVLAYVPFEGPKIINGEDWAPYQPCSFVTPPFPEYPSGHSAFSAAGAEILKRFTGSDAFGDSVTFKAGSGRTEPGFAPSKDVTLSWATFSEAADQAGMSRRYGGIHFEQGDLDSRHLGRLVAGAVWDKAQSYIDGTAGRPRLAARQPLNPVPDLLDGKATANASFGITSITPSPTAGEARVEFSLPQAGLVRVDVIDVRGREVTSLAAGRMEAGSHHLLWSPKGSAAPAPGTYFLRYEALGETMVRKFVVVR
jgi:hypothetical protein